MSTMTLEQVRDRLLAEYEYRKEGTAGDQYRAGWAKEMADAIDAILRERESAKAGVTDEMVCRADVAQREFFESTPFTGDSDRLTHESVRAALEAVAPILASVRVSELENALRMVVTANAMLSEIEGGKTLYEGSPTHSTPCLLAWINLNTAIANAKQALAAAPKPEKE